MGQDTSGRMEYAGNTYCSYCERFIFFLSNIAILIGENKSGDSADLKYSTKLSLVGFFLKSSKDTCGLHIYSQNAFKYFKS